MVDIFSIGFFVVLTLFFFYWAVSKKSYFAGIACAFVLVIFGILFLSTGVGFPASDNSTIVYSYDNISIKGDVFNATGDFRGYVSFNDSLLTSKSLLTTYNYNTTRDAFTDSLGLLIIFAGLIVGFETALLYFQNRKAIADGEEMRKLDEENEL